MKNKYYTPSIEEFHVGFEFESNYVLHRPCQYNHDTDFGKWYQVTINKDNCGWFWDSYENDAYPTEFRVKYLAREDIESLEFVCKFKEGDYPLLYEMSDYTLIHYSETNNIIITDKVKTLFRGTIKNKSELVKLLKQLGIL